MEGGVGGVHARRVLVLVQLPSDIRCENNDGVPELDVLLGELVL